MYKTSPNHYEGYWPCNAAKALPVFDLRGLTAINRPVLQSFIDVQTDDVGGLREARWAMARRAKARAMPASRLPGQLRRVDGEPVDYQPRPGHVGPGLALPDHARSSVAGERVRIRGWKR